MATSLRRVFLANLVRNITKERCFTKSNATNLTCTSSKQMLVIPGSVYRIESAGYAKKFGKPGKGQDVAAVKDEPLEVNRDPEDIVKYCLGSNYFKEGDDVELKPDDEYPDWLWELDIGPPKTLEELDPNSIKYWRKLKKLHIQRQNRMQKLKKF